MAGIWGSIFADFDRFWGPSEMPVGSKMEAENEVRKKSEKGCFKYMNRKGSRSPNNSYNHHPVASRWPLAASSQQDGNWDGHGDGGSCRKLKHALRGLRHGGGYSGSV